MATTYNQIVYPGSNVEKLGSEKAIQAHSALAELVALHPQAIHIAELKANGIVKLSSAIRTGRA